MPDGGEGVAHYRVEVRGAVGRRFDETFDVLHVEQRGLHTILTVDLQDQAALHCMFEVLESTGVELVAVNPVPLTADADGPGEGPSPG